MHYRTFGRVGWEISEIGMGTWSMSGLWGSQDDREAIRSIRRALDLGLNFIDTARVYGEGHSEQLIAKALAQRTTPVRIATKVPPKNMEWPPRDLPVREVFPAEWVRDCTELSLRRLKRETIDLQQLHVWAPRWLAEQDEWLPVIEQLKRSGKIRAFGISINDCQPDSALELVASGLIDSVQVIYNIFEQAPERSLLPLCQAHGIGVIARVPFDEGSFTGQFTRETVFGPEDWRGAYFQGDRLRETVERVERLGFLLREEIQTMPQAALKFCLTHPAVSTVIPGMRTVTHVEENCRVSDGKRLAAHEREALHSHAWPRNFYLQDNGISIFAE